MPFIIVKIHFQVSLKGVIHEIFEEYIVYREIFNKLLLRIIGILFSVSVQMFEDKIGKPAVTVHAFNGFLLICADRYENIGNDTAASVDYLAFRGSEF